MHKEELSDNVYVNITIPHDNSNGAAVSRAIFNETYTNPIIQDPSQYYLSVVKFVLGGQLIPINVIEIQPFPNTNPN